MNANEREEQNAPSTIEARDRAALTRRNAGLTAGATGDRGEKSRTACMRAAPPFHGAYPNIYLTTLQAKCSARGDFFSKEGDNGAQERSRGLPPPAKTRHCRQWQERQVRSRLGQAAMAGSASAGRYTPFHELTGCRGRGGESAEAGSRVSWDSRRRRTFAPGVVGPLQLWHNSARSSKCQENREADRRDRFPETARGVLHSRCGGRRVPRTCEPPAQWQSRGPGIRAVSR